MKQNWEQCFALVIKNEGGFVNNPKDPGGMTNLGVTKKVWESYVGRTADETEMRSLTPEIVKPLYKKLYWDAVRGDDLPDGVDYAVYDLAVNSGVRRAIKILQKSAGVPDDGVLGPATLAAVEDKNARELAQDVCEMRLAFLQGLSTFDTFGKGWSRRVAEVERTAFDMVG